MDDLIELVTEATRRYPDRPALLIRPTFRTRVWRYRDLGRDVPRAARVLAEAGVNAGDRVIIWAVNRPEWGIAFFAVAHAGAISVPLDARHTNEFAAKVAAQTGATHVLASRQTADGARSLGLPIIWIETLPDHARRAEPLPAAPITAGRPGGDRLHERDHRRSEGGDDLAREPHGVCHRDGPGLPAPARRASAVGPPVVPPVRAGDRADHSDAGWRERRLSGQPTARRPAPRLPRLPGDDAAHRAPGPASARSDDRAAG